MTVATFEGAVTDVVLFSIKLVVFGAVVPIEKMDAAEVVVAVLKGKTVAVVAAGVLVSPNNAVVNGVTVYPVCIVDVFAGSCDNPVTVGVVVVGFPKVKIDAVMLATVVVVLPILNPLVLGATELDVPKLIPVVAEVCVPSAPVSTVGVACKLNSVGTAVPGVLTFAVELANPLNAVAGAIVAPIVGAEVFGVLPKVKPVL